MGPPLYQKHLSSTDIRSCDWFNICQPKGWNLSSLAMPQPCEFPEKINLSCTSPSCVWSLLSLSSNSTHLSFSGPQVSVHCCCGATRRRRWGREGGSRMAAGPCRANNTGSSPWQLTKANTAQWCCMARWTGGQAGLQGGGRKLPDSLHDVWQLCKPQYMKQSLSDKGKEDGKASLPPPSICPLLWATSYDLYQLYAATSLSTCLETWAACQNESHLLSQHWKPGQGSWGKSLHACMFPVSGWLHQLCLRASVDPAAAFHFHL